jgi:hypothetical protein
MAHLLHPLGGLAPAAAQHRGSHQPVLAQGAKPMGDSTSATGAVEVEAAAVGHGHRELR